MIEKNLIRDIQTVEKKIGLMLIIEKSSKNGYIDTNMCSGKGLPDLEIFLKKTLLDILSTKIDNMEQIILI
jgi:hypothetical protein